MNTLIIFHRYLFKNKIHSAMEIFHTNKPKNEALRDFTKHFYKTKFGCKLLEGKRYTRAYFIDELRNMPAIHCCYKGMPVFVFYTVIGRNYTKSFVSKVIVEPNKNKYYMKQQAKENFIETHHLKFNNTRFDRTIRVFFIDQYFNNSK